MNKTLLLILSILLTFGVSAYGSNIPATKSRPPLSQNQKPDNLLKVKRKVFPSYPKQATEQQISGWVQMEFKLNKRGKPFDVKIVRASHDKLFDESATRAIKRWRFTLPGDYDAEKSYTHRLDFSAP